MQARHRIQTPFVGLDRAAVALQVHVSLAKLIAGDAQEGILVDRRHVGLRRELEPLRGHVFLPHAIQVQRLPAGLIVGEALREQGGAEGQDEKRDACGESDGHGASRKPKKKGDHRSGPPSYSDRFPV